MRVYYVWREKKQQLRTDKEKYTQTTSNGHRYNVNVIIMLCKYADIPRGLLLIGGAGLSDGVSNEPVIV